MPQTDLAAGGLEDDLLVSGALVVDPDGGRRVDDHLEEPLVVLEDQLHHIIERGVVGGPEPAGPGWPGQGILGLQMDRADDAECVEPLHPFRRVYPLQPCAPSPQGST